MTPTQDRLVAALEKTRRIALQGTGSTEEWVLVADTATKALTAHAAEKSQEITVDDIARIMRLNPDDFNQGHSLIYLREYLYDNGPICIVGKEGG